MSYLVINGGKPLRGSVTVQANKNSALSIIAASLLIRGRTVLRDVPVIDDVEHLLTLLVSLGVKVKRQGRRVVIDAKGPLKLSALSKPAAGATRAALLLWGALASRARQYRLYRAGGCHLGERTVRPHLYALAKLGLQIAAQGNYYTVRAPARLRGASVVMYESGDTATENVILAAVLARGTTIVKFASANYMVQDLCYFLQAAGAQIEGIGTTTLTIRGVSALRPVQNYPIMPDPIVAMTLLSAGIATGSRLTVRNCPLEFLELELEKLAVMGQRFTVSHGRPSGNGQFMIGDITIFPGRLRALPDKIYGRPFPGLNIDNLVLFIPILARAAGRTLVHDWAYENRALYSLELQKLGVQVTLLDPHRLFVEGPTKFEPNEIICPPALRPAVNILIGMLAAPGRSILRNHSIIDRGYENLYALLNSLGADVTIVRS
ncbi:MAG: UDP-N-acetylglucosamine 1-carboxyvinyltransferase [Candidatus Magasanikbacteria bacterium]|nr:UDP-N-acetylglucosamine 1-carboxyvinyltransferase [Candidatus Magasanikbacteria bacterium]